MQLIIWIYKVTETNSSYASLVSGLCLAIPIWHLLNFSDKFPSPPLVWTSPSSDMSLDRLCDDFGWLIVAVLAAAGVSGLAWILVGCVVYCLAWTEAALFSWCHVPL